MQIDFSSYSFLWSDIKNKLLKETRNISFDEVSAAINRNELINVLPNKSKYPNQFILIVKLHNYPYAVPCEINKNIITLKTIFPCGKYKYLFS